MSEDVRERGRRPFRWRLPSQKADAEIDQARPAPVSCTVYTVGLCDPARGAGGWAYLMLIGEQPQEESGEEWDTSQQRLELIAAAQGLAATTPQSSVTLYTNAQAVVHGMTKRIDAWARHGWHTAAGQPIADRDLWTQLQALAAERHVDWQWLKVHPEQAQAPYNRRVHLLAETARRQAISRAARSGSASGPAGSSQPRRVEDSDPALEVEKGAQLADDASATAKGVQLHAAMPATDVPLRTAAQAIGMARTAETIDAVDTVRMMDTTPEPPFALGDHGRWPHPDTVEPGNLVGSAAAPTPPAEDTARPAHEDAAEAAHSAEEDRLMSSSDAPPFLTTDTEAPGRAETAPSPTAQVGARDVSGATPAGGVPERDGRRDALMAECQALERRWAELHEQLVHLDDEWRRLMEPITGSRAGVEGDGQQGRLPGWADGALMYYEIDRHAERLSGLSMEALQTCNRYAAALQRATGALEP